VLREKSCGVVPFRKEDTKVLYLVISSALTRREHWEFPKGGVEEGERELDTALRELMEETGVTDVTILRGFREPIHYIYRRPEGLVSKQVVYFLGQVNDPRVVLREVEAKDYRWATYDEAKKLLRHANARSLLDRAHARITGQPPGAPQRPVAPSVGDAAEKADAAHRRRRRRHRGRRRIEGAPGEVPAGAGRPATIAPADEAAAVEAPGALPATGPAGNEPTEG
jgi:8-oxo-dGTP pyrophosphatase MutT (NUDIX family)